MIRVLPIVVLAACSSSRPHWALDPIHVVPDGEFVSGTQTWQLYSKPWQKKFDGRHYLCGLVVEVAGDASQPDCPDCVAAFDVEVEMTDTDCTEGQAAQTTFESLRRIGFGPLDETGPYPNSSSIGYADYGGGWEVHGWAYVAGVDVGAVEDGGAWNGVDAFVLDPTFVWDLTAPGVAPVSRSPRVMGGAEVQ